jgi:REP element-mobilizing transposase RayT
MEHTNFCKSLRNKNINYKNGYFFITIQVNQNKSIFGAIVGDKVERNFFGDEVWKYWLKLPLKYPELEIIESVLMPNHFHAIVRIHYRAANHENHLGFLVGRFKGGAAFIYGKHKRAGLVEDIGQYLWQRDYWEKLVTSEQQLKAQIKYIRENPQNWSRDRYGACTSYFLGNLALLNERCIAFVASQGFSAGSLKPRRAKARFSDIPQHLLISEQGASSFSTQAISEQGASPFSQNLLISEQGASPFSTQAISEQGASAPNPPLISTFTSPQEREVLRRALAKNRRIIQVVPQGIPSEAEFPQELVAACKAGNALLLSPQPSGSTLNKKVATWCNEYVLRHASEIWIGDISCNGMLRSMLNAFNINL